MADARPAHVDTPTACNVIGAAQGKRGFSALTRGAPLWPTPGERLPQHSAAVKMLWAGERIVLAPSRQGFEAWERFEAARA